MPTRRIDGAHSLAGESDGTLVAIGNFDGVHRGHRVVLAAAVARARTQSLAPLVLTFDPHPAVVLGRGRQATLTPLERKVELLCRVDPALRVVVEPFTESLAEMSPEAFANDLLVHQLSARVVIVGENFRFGHRRAGDLGTLRDLGEKLGFDAFANPLEADAGGPISSSRIRDAIQSGDLVLAERLLGRPHAVRGSVVAGQRRGRTIGVPTANLDSIAEVLPANGVYACLVDRLDSRRFKALAQGVANVGDRPTTGAGFGVEVHLLDHSADLYGAELRVHLIQRLRDERQFPGLEALKVQIAADITAAREILADRQPAPDAAGAWY